jgi:hypothetical protein
MHNAFAASVAEGNPLILVGKVLTVSNAREIVGVVDVVVAAAFTETSSSDIPAAAE